MIADQWSPLGLIRESIRNIATSRWRLIPLVYLACAAGAALALTASLEGTALDRDLDQLSERGRNVVVFSSDSRSDTRFSRASCESLTDLADVVRSGVILTSIRTDVLPLGSEIPVVQVSSTLFPGLADADALIGAGLRPVANASSVLVRGVSLAAATAPAQPEGIPTNQAVVVAAPATVTEADRCFAVLTRGSKAQEAIPLLKARLETVGGNSVGSAVLTEPIDRLDTYLDRLSRWLPLIVGGVGGLATLLIAMSRSNEFAAYRLSGTSRGSLLGILAAETALISGVMVTTATLVALALAPNIPSLSAAAMSFIGAGCAWFAVTVAGSTFIVRRSLLSITKER